MKTGDIFALSSAVEAFPSYAAPAGAIGKIKQIQGSIIFLELLSPLDGGAYVPWHNCIEWDIEKRQALPPLRVPRFIEAFPDYDDPGTAAQLIAQGWQDESFKNDLMPRFHYNGWALFADYENPELREFPDKNAKRFALHSLENGLYMTNGPVFESDSLEETCNKMFDLLKIL